MKQEKGNQKFEIYYDGILQSSGVGAFNDFYEIGRASFANLKVKFVPDLEKFKTQQKGGNENDNI